MSDTLTDVNKFRGIPRTRSTWVSKEWCLSLEIAGGTRGLGWADVKFDGGQGSMINY